MRKRWVRQSNIDQTSVAKAYNRTGVEPVVMDTTQNNSCSSPDVHE